MQAGDMEDARLEAERFLQRLRELVACRKPLTSVELGRPGYVRNPHAGGCPETAAVRRASLDLTRSLARMRRP